MEKYIIWKKKKKFTASKIRTRDAFETRPLLRLDSLLEKKLIIIEMQLYFNLYRYIV